jgi:hypothetical protein
MSEQIYFTFNKPEHDEIKLDQIACIIYVADDGVRFHHNESMISSVDLFNLLVELADTYHKKVEEQLDANLH